MSNTFRFAWVNQDTAFDADVHNVEDEKVIAFAVEQTETELATLTMTIRNPRIGFLNASRKVWMWLSYFSPVTLTVVPLFYGRLVGFPSDLNKEIVTVQFLARPSDFATQKELMASDMRVLPYYDPVFVATDKQLDPDVVLEARTQVWHVDRVTHDLTVSDLIVGEDGVEEFQESEVPYDSVVPSFDQPPVRNVEVTAEVGWTQSVSGEGLHMFKNWEVETLAGKGVVNGFPAPLDDLGGGWHVTASRAASPYQNLTEADWANWYITGNFGTPPFAVQVLAAFSSAINANAVSQSSTLFAIISDKVFCDLTLGYVAQRTRKDTVVFNLIADTQAILTQPDDEDKLLINISGNDVGLPTNPYDLDDVPIGDVRRRSYFTQERGMQSLQYLIQLARANIILRSRAIKIVFKCSFERAIGLSLRKNALLHDRRLPGGQALGKIVAYSFKSEGGEISGMCTIACAIGRGGEWEEDAGEGDYAAPGYMAPGYQRMEGKRVVLGASDVAFYPLDENANDDGLAFPLQAVPVTESLHNETVETKALTTPQATYQGNTSPDACGNTTSISVSSTLDTSPYNDWLSGIRTTVNFSMKAVEGGPFESTYRLIVTDLKIPQQIDLEAASS